MTTTDKETEKQGPIDALKNQSLKAAGVAYLIGDAAIIATGFLDDSKTPKEQMQHSLVGVYWGLGGLTAARYGNPKEEKQLELLSSHLGDYLKKQGVEIPDSPSTEALTKQGGIIDHIETFLYKHPSEVLNAIYALGAVQLARSGRTAMKNKTGKDDRRLAGLDIASGALIGAGALSGLLIKEKKPDPEHPAKGVLGKAKAWIQEKPLRASGILYTANNVSMILAARTDQLNSKNTGNQGYKMRYVTAATYVFANAMLAISSKNHGGNISANTSEKLATSAANVIAAQPPALQDALVMQISGYLAGQPEIDKKPNEIASLLQSKLAEVKTAMSNDTGTKWQQSVSHSSLSTAPTI